MKTLLSTEVLYKRLCELDLKPDRAINIVIDGYGLRFEYMTQSAKMLNHADLGYHVFTHQTDSWITLRNALSAISERPMVIHIRENDLTAIFDF